jgi:hypothetical protein
MAGFLQRVLGLDPMDRNAYRFAARVLLIVALVAILELRSTDTDTKNTGVAWFYSIAIYAIAAVTFARSTSVTIASGFVLAGILLVASIHGAYEIIMDLGKPRSYELPKYDTDTWVTIALALASAAMLFRFRTTDNAVQRATWTLALVDVLTSLEDVVSIAVINWAESPTLSLASDCFDVTTTFVGAVMIIFESRREMLENYRVIAGA